MSEKKKSIDEWIADGTLYPIGSLIVVHYGSNLRDYFIIKKYSNLLAHQHFRVGKKAIIQEILMTVRCLRSGKDFAWFFADTDPDHSVLRAPTF